MDGNASTSGRGCGYGSRIESAIRLLFAWHLRLYPRRFREAFGGEMREAFSLRLREIGCRHPEGFGRWLPLGGLVARTGLDGLRAAISERLRSSFDTGRAGRGAPGFLPPDPQRGAGHGTGLECVLRDIRFALRSLWMRPLFTSVAVLTLGLGIGCATSVFSVVDGVLIRPLPYADPGSLVTVVEVQRQAAEDQAPHIAGRGLPFTWQDYLLLRDAVTLMDVAVFHGAGEMPLTGAGSPEQLSVGLASANLFDLLGVGFHMGRGFVAGEDGDVVGQAAQSVVLSHELWRRRFGGDPGVLGAAVNLGGTPFVVVGVLPSGFRLQSEIMNVVRGGTDLGLRDLWVPLGQPGGGLQSQGNAFEVLGRLHDGVTPTQARAEVDAILANTPGGQPQGARIIPRQEIVTRGFGAPLVILFVGAGLLLLVACANVATLLVSEATQRRTEIATRAALGAGRRQLWRQLLTESVLLGLAGSLAGIALAAVGTRVLLELAPPIPRIEEVVVGTRVLAFAVGAGLGTGVLFGLAPMAVLLRSPLSGVLARRSRGASQGRTRFQAGAVVVQYTLTVVLLVLGGLFARSLLTAGHIDPGFRPDGVATLRVDVPSGRYPAQDDVSRYFQQVVQALEAEAGVESVAGSYGLPFPGGAPTNGLEIPSGSGVGMAARRRTVLPAYHETLGIPLVSGRYLADTDAADRPRAMVISESLARRFWDDSSPVGTTVAFWGADWTIVGVVGDVRHTDVFSQGEPTFYVPFAQAPRRNLNLVVRTAGDPADALPRLQDAVWTVDRDIPLTELGTLRGLMDASLAEARFRALLVLVLGAMAAVVAAVGIFGLTARAVARSGRELGIRMALGARRRRLLAGTLGRGLLLAGTGLATGLAAAMEVDRVVAHLIVGVEPGDPLVYAVVIAGLLVVCCTAILVPAMRVASLEPSTVLREE